MVTGRSTQNVHTQMIIPSESGWKKVNEIEVFQIYHMVVNHKHPKYVGWVLENLIVWIVWNMKLNSAFSTVKLGLRCAQYIVWAE